ncbi:hypothetical protein [Clostridium butyricum]|uniref:hypothetical protein n=1 Tax=Clostridium butyricum TaxID=1492 RepID=UPI0002D184F9|nr:hypothetical protein [Clostridium butyricum]ENZ33324.1 hypothetical protein HMPREF1084_01792 [Clostridium butyricum 60E.3]
MNVKCSKCNLSWNVSIKADLSKPYLCPVCRKEIKNTIGDKNEEHKEFNFKTKEIFRK